MFVQWLRRTRCFQVAALTAAVWGTSAGVETAEPNAADLPAQQSKATHFDLVPAEPATFRGVFFNPNIKHEASAGYPWPNFDHYEAEYRQQIRRALHELANEAKINLIDLFIPIPFTLLRPGQAPRKGQPLAEWANTRYLDSVAVFVDDCHDAGLSVEFDLADSRWLPNSVAMKELIGYPWPAADEAPWESAAEWYRAVIERVEAKAKNPTSIAMWCMAGNYHWGTAEPDLWGDDRVPAISASTEKFVKRVWPMFRAAGKRPKAAPIMLPIFSNSAGWKAKTPEQRLAGFRNLKRWLVDDLALPPDYWVMSSYPFCDPAPDGCYYFRRIVDILGQANAARIISTDLKGPGHQRELKESIISADGHADADILQWHFRKCAEYGFGGWWVFSYQDQEASTLRTGIRFVDGRWKTELLKVVREQAADK